MSSVRSPLVGVLSLAILTACVADAPRSGVSAGDVASTPAPAGVTPADSATPGVSEPSASTATASGSATVAPGDSLNPRLVPGRSKMDASSFAAAVRAGLRKEASWPKGPPPLAGALLPKNRIIAYYGNPHSKKMGVIGEYPEPQMLAMWDRTVAQWKAADRSGAGLAVMVGRDELARDAVAVKDLASGEQVEVPRTGLVAWLVARKDGNRS
jgi:hypothetical protein